MTLSNGSKIKPIYDNSSLRKIGANLRGNPLLDVPFL
jgi:hypothetical protein